MKTRKIIKTIELEEVLVKYQLGAGARKVPVGQGEGKILEMWVLMQSTYKGSDGTRYLRIVHGHGDYSDLPVE